MMETEQEETEHLWTTIKVARDEDLGEQIGRDIYFDLVDHEKVRSFHIQKQIPFNVFKEEVSKVLGIPVQFQRFWMWAKRQNHTYRPCRPLTKLEEKQPVGMLKEISQLVPSAELKLFLEVELGPHFCPIVPPDKTRNDILLFFKHYDPEKEELRYVGRLFVESTGEPIEILSRLNEMAGYNPDEEIDLYEEIKFEPTIMCEQIDKNLSFRISQLEDGDIICFQKSLPVESAEQFRYPDVPSFLEYVHNRQFVHFRSLEKPKEDDFCLEMSKLYTYDDVVENVAQQFGLDDPSKIRLTAHNCYSQQPKPQPIKYRGVDHLSDMIVCYNQASDILYYEVLDNPLPELQCLKTLKVAFHHATKDEVIIHFIRLPKQSTVGDVLKDLKTKVELSHPNAELRLLEVFYHKIYKIFSPNEKIENINDRHWTLRAEEIPEEEKNLGPKDRLIRVYHFTKDTAQNQMQIQNFGEPFFLVIHEGETLAEIKLQIQKKLLVPDEEFAKWKFAFLSLGHPEYLQDCDILSSCFQRRDLYGAWSRYLGLEHSDNAPKRYYTANKERLKKEHEEKLLKKKKAEAQLCTIIKVARDEDLGEQIGRDIYFDLVDYDKVQSFHFEKQTPFSVFKEEAAKVFGIPVQFQRFWLWAKRENRTYRPKLPLTHLDETQPVGKLVEVSNKAQNAELKLFLEVELGVDLQPIAPPDKAKKDILLFFKHYNPEKKELRYVGRLFVKRTGKPAEILSRLNEMAGYSPDEDIDLFEEIQFEPTVMCESIDKKITFGASQLGDGDIICFQMSLPVERTEKFLYPDVPSFLEYLHNRQVVHFRSLENPKEADFCLEMSKVDTYNNVVEKVAQQLGLNDPSKIRLTAHNCYSQQPKPQPIQYRGVSRLSEMLVHYNKSSSILYYEV